MPALLIPLISFFITTVAPKLISWFVGDEQAKAAALADFYAAIRAHANDGLVSAQERLSAASQEAELSVTANLRDQAEERAQAIAAKAIEPKS